MLDTADTASDPILAKYEQWVQAVKTRDRSALEGLLAPEYRYTGHDGERLDRAAILDIEMVVPAPGWPFLSIDVQHLGDLAIARGEHSLKGEIATEDLGDELAQRAVNGVVMAFSTVWLRRRDDWQAVSNDAHIKGAPAHNDSKTDKEMA